MVSIIIIPITIVGILGISGYLIYRFFIFDYICNKSVNGTLRKYNIKKSQFQIIKEYFENKGESLSDEKIMKLAKQFRQREPEQFLVMYDFTRDKSRTD